METLPLAIVGLAGSLVGSVLSTPMLWPTAARPASVRLLGAWLIAVSTIAALISGRLLGLAPATAATNHAINLLGFGAYPLVYLWILEQTGRSSLSREWRWLWIPSGFYACALIVRGSLGLSTHVPFAVILPVICGFTALCAVAAFRGQNAAATAIIPARFVVGFLILLNASQVIRMLFGHLQFVPAAVPITIAAGVLGLSAVLVNRALDIPSAGSGEPSAPRYDRSGLDETAALAVLDEIQKALVARRVFTKPDLTLRELASAIGATTHQVSEALNRHAHTTFNELVNGHRVAEVKSQLLDSNSDRFTIEGIGLAAGFGSRSALYAAFRRMEGMTPAEFRAQARANDREASR